MSTGETERWEPAADTADTYMWGAMGYKDPSQGTQNLFLQEESSNTVEFLL